MGNKLVVRFRKVLGRNQSGDSKTKSITYGTESNFKHISIVTDGHDSVVDNLGNFTRSASSSVKSAKAFRNKVSFPFSNAYISYIKFNQSTDHYL